MGVPVNATCSECLTMFRTTLEFGQEQLKCPSCGHAMQNLPEGEINEIETTYKKQRFNSVISIIGFILAATSFGVWVGNQDPFRKTDDFMMTSGYPGMIIVGLLVCIIFGILGSLKRHIVEF